MMGQATLNGKLLQFSFEIICFSTIGFYLGSSIKMKLHSTNINSYTVTVQSSLTSITTTTTIR
jgi:hypothetical protein